MTFAAPFSRVFRPLFGPGLAAAVSAVVTLIYDTFTDTDATALASHAIAPTNTPATAWTVHQGALQVISNRASPPASTPSGAHLNAGVADCTLLADVLVRCSSTGTVRDAGFRVRYSNTSNYWRVGGNDQLNPQVIRIVERKAGSDTARASTNTTATYLNNPVAMTVVLSGSTITLSIDNNAYSVTYANATLNQTATLHGIVNEIITGYIDDFTVTVP